MVIIVSCRLSLTMIHVQADHALMGGHVLDKSQTLLNVYVHHHIQVLLVKQIL
jgi:hypothetical protein